MAAGGVLLMYTVNAQSLELKAYSHEWGGFTKNHLMFWEPDTVSQLLRKVGFSGIAFRPFYGKAIERDKWRFSERERARLVNNVERYQSGNMMRLAAFTSPEEAAGIEGTRRL